jgi:UDP-glucose 4-epimerase
LRRGEPIDILGDGRQMRDFTYVADAVAALKAAMPAASASAPLFNVCTGKGTTVRQLAGAIADLCKTELVAYFGPARLGEIPISIGNPQRAAEMLGFSASTALARGLALTLDWVCTEQLIEPRAVA